jgi:hypothetical protein
MIVEHYRMDYGRDVLAVSLSHFDPRRHAASRSFDHLVCAQQESCRYIEIDRLGGLEVEGLAP